MNKILLFITVMILAPFTLRANMAAWTAGNNGTGAIIADEKAEVEMREMALDIKLYTRYADVSVEYQIVNDGGEQAIDVAFPCLRLCEGESPHGKCLSEIDDYVIEVNGNSVDAKMVNKGKTKFKARPSEEGGRIDLGWYVSKLVFTPKESKKVRISYKSIYLSSGVSVSWVKYTIEPDIFRYLLSTAKGWKGPIKKGKIQIIPIRYDAKNISVIPPNRFLKETNGNLVWSFEDLEPTEKDDLEICMNNGYKYDHEYKEGDRRKVTFNYLTKNGEHYNVFKADEVRASSILAPGIYHGQEIRYNPELTMDQGNEGSWIFPMDTCWCTGVKGDGKGEWISFSFSEPKKVTHVGIVPGVAASKELYFKNNRISELEILVNGEHATVGKIHDEYFYADDPIRAWQWVKLGKYIGEAKSIKITILGTYLGSLNDTCISDVTFIEKLDSKP